MNLNTLLIANRGEIACRIIRTARAMGIRTVAVYTEADASALHVRDADEGVRLEEGYLDGTAILAAAKATGAQAIHPGYGFLSENADFARAVEAAGLAWVGPGADAIAQMGDKLEAKALAVAHNILVLPGSADLTEAEAIGYPILVKAAAGGGGKGMRIVERAEDLDEAIASAQREAKSGFGDDRVFLERYVRLSRHIEIQILGDAAGNLVHLGERECSIQRRHQKILEESPSPRVDEAMRAAMGDAALTLARALAYRSAGTVEFLVDDETGEFFFLEVNTRLQVEHPVTEEVTGIDLVREQLRIAEGHPISFAQADLQFSGAAIEARLYAEDPANDFLPATGTIHAFAPADEPAVRFDTGIEAGTVVGTDFDPMLAKIIAKGPTRAEAAGRLALALSRLHLGGVVTNRDFLVATLRSDAFLAGETTTDFIAREAPSPALSLSAADLTRAARVAALWIQGANRAEAQVLATTQTGWTNGHMPFQHISLGIRERAPDGDTGAKIDVRYRSQRDHSFVFDDGEIARIRDWTPTFLDLEIGGRRLRGHVTRAASQLIVQTPQGDVEFEIVPRFVIPGDEGPTGGLVAPMPGKVIDLRVQVGDVVEAGQTVLVLEAMKMEHPMRAPYAGSVSEIRVVLDDQVENGALLLVVDPPASDATDSTKKKN